MGGNRLVLWLGGVAVLAILAVAVLLIIPGLLPSTDINTTLTPDASIAGEATPVPPTATPTPVPTVAPQEAILRLNYNVDLIVLVNDGPSTLYMDQLRFRSAEETYSLTPALGAIQPGECLIVKNSAQSANVPDVWRCTEVRSTTITAGEPRFWFADSDTDQSFGIFSDSRQVGDCDTIGRLVNRMDDVSCPVEWPDFDTERQIIN